jgi:hypothetical protein
MGGEVSGMPPQATMPDARRDLLIRHGGALGRIGLSVLPGRVAGAIPLLAAAADAHVLEARSLAGLLRAGHQRLLTVLPYLSRDRDGTVVPSGASERNDDGRRSVGRCSGLLCRKVKVFPHKCCFDCVALRGFPLRHSTYSCYGNSLTDIIRV